MIALVESSGEFSIFVFCPFYSSNADAVLFEDNSLFKFVFIVNLFSCSVGS